jgi:hypothetical protein
VKALLSFLWSGCWHKWSIHREGPCEAMWAAWYYDLRCEHCGNIKRTEV